MINNKKILAIIPGRGGSKGVPGKNIRLFAGKPLIAWTIEEAKKSKYIDRLILSSEDSKIIDVAKFYGCDVPFIRPKELSDDKTAGIEPVIHAIHQIPDYDYVVLLQITSPFRNVDDIDSCIEQMVENKSSSCVSVTEPEKSPYWMYTLNNMSELNPVIKYPFSINRRQELPIVYALNGAVYAAEKNWLLDKKNFLGDETTAYIMPQDRSYDIDTEQDFRICEFLMKEIISSIKNHRT
ncbi:acylneuraminate cytidylyltransferase family protein [Exiguobacterium undae]